MTETHGVPKVAVTGAGGALGQVLVRRLLDEGNTVRALVRKDTDAEALRELGAMPIMGDMRDATTLAQLLQEVEVAYHLAAWMGKPANPNVARAVNVEGTAALVRLAAESGVERVVLASSIAVYGPVRQGRIDETQPTWSVGDAYGDTKIEAERVAKEEAERGGVELVILRPTMIYGPASPSWTLTPFDTIKKGLPIIIGDGRDLLDAVYIDDVAQAFVKAGTVPEAAGETFNVGGEPVDWNTFMGYYAKMADVKLRRIPASLAWNGAKAAAGVTRLLTGSPKVIPELVGVMTSRATFPSAKAQQILEYAPQTALEEGMRRTEGWLRRTGRLKRATIALVTGAASGLGKATVRGLLDKGLTVYASDLDVGALADLEAAGAYPLQLDVTSDASVEAALDKVRQEGRHIDLLINVAGVLKPGALETQAMSDIQLQFEVNTFGPLRIARAVSQGMRERGWGRIINVSSTNGFMVTPFMGAYSASKYAIEALSDALRLELQPFGVEVALVQPGAMKTPFANRAKDALRAEIERSGETWRPYLEGFLNGNLWGESTATAPEKVAKVVVRVALASRLRARTYGTLDAVPTRVMAMMPDLVKDSFFRKAAGLNVKPNEALGNKS